MYEIKACILQNFYQEIKVPNNFVTHFEKSTVYYISNTHKIYIISYYHTRVGVALVTRMTGIRIS